MTSVNMFGCVRNQFPLIVQNAIRGAGMEERHAVIVSLMRHLELRKRRIGDQIFDLQSELEEVLNQIALLQDLIK